MTSREGWERSGKGMRKAKDQHHGLATTPLTATAVNTELPSSEGILSNRMPGRRGIPVYRPGRGALITLAITNHIVGFNIPTRRSQAAQAPTTSLFVFRYGRIKRRPTVTLQSCPVGFSSAGPSSSSPASPYFCLLSPPLRLDVRPRQPTRTPAACSPTRGSLDFASLRSRLPFFTRPVHHRLAFPLLPRSFRPSHQLPLDDSLGQTPISLRRGFPSLHGTFVFLWWPKPPSSFPHSPTASPLLGRSHYSELCSPKSTTSQPTPSCPLPIPLAWPAPRI